MSLNWSFRFAQRADVPQLNRLVNSSFRGESGRKAWTGEAHLLDGQRTDEQDLENLISERDSYIIVAEAKADEGPILGCVSITKKAQSCYLGMLTVNVDLQRSGLGSALMKEAEMQARRMFRSHEVEMTVISIRTELIEWYLKRGYVVTGEKRPFPYGNERFGRPLRPDLEFNVLKKKLTSD